MTTDSPQNRPRARRRRGRPPATPGRRVVNHEALRWLLIGFLAGTGVTGRPWTAQDLADFTEVPKQRVSAILNGTGGAHADYVLSLLDIMDVKPGEVMMPAPASPAAAPAEEAPAA